MSVVPLATDRPPCDRIQHTVKALVVGVASVDLLRVVRGVREGAICRRSQLAHVSEGVAVDGDEERGGERLDVGVGENAAASSASSEGSLIILESDLLQAGS